MNRKPKEKSKFRKWWNKNSYKVWRVILFPIWLCSMAKEKIVNYLNSRNEWDEERADEILNYYVPRRAEWVAEENEFYFFDNGWGWGRANKYLKRKDRRFWKVNSGAWGYKMRDYLVSTFELEGFKKEIISTGDWTEISFKKI